MGHPVATEFLDSELGWSSFEKKETQNKIRYFGRIRTMSQNRWPRLIMNMMETTNCRSNTYLRTEELKRKYQCGRIMVHLDIENKHLLQPRHLTINGNRIPTNT